MDYQLEAYNTMTFKKHMEGLDGIKVATVYPEFTSRKIIVTEWIVGERLGDSKTEDVRALCSTLLNCYLIQLLETGLLHADPHPGEQQCSDWAIGRPMQHYCDAKKYGDSHHRCHVIYL